MRSHRRVARAVTASVAIAVLAAGCSSSSDQSAASTVTTEVVLQAPIVETDFCSRMYAIRIAALQGESSSDTNELILQYQEALAVAPIDVQPDLEALIATLSSTAPATTATPEVIAENDDGEGWQPSADPAVRVFEYVETYCGGTASNPGPAATDPP